MFLWVNKSPVNGELLPTTALTAVEWVHQSVFNYLTTKVAQDRIMCILASYRGTFFTFGFQLFGPVFRSFVASSLSKVGHIMVVCFLAQTINLTLDLQLLVKCLTFWHRKQHFFLATMSFFWVIIILVALKHFLLSWDFSQNKQATFDFVLLCELSPE